MKQEELFKALIKELFELDTTHQEYQDNDTHFVVDSEVDGNTLTIKVELIDNSNKDKKEFEQWLSKIDDKLLEEILDELKDEGLCNLQELYESVDYMQVIDAVKQKAHELLLRKVQILNQLFK